MKAKEKQRRAEFLSKKRAALSEISFIFIEMLIVSACVQCTPKWGNLFYEIKRR